MKIKCYECKKETEEMKHIVDEVYICKCCYTKTTHNILTITNEFKDW